MSIQNSLEDLRDAQSPENATVSDLEFIQPAQRYIENMEYAVKTLTYLSLGVYDNLDLSNRGITDLKLHQSPAGFYLQFSAGSFISVAGNKMPDASVFQFFEDMFYSGEYTSSSNYNIYADGPEMGTPLTGGTAGGWTLDLLGYAGGLGYWNIFPNQTYFPLIPVSYLILDNSIPYSASSYVTVDVYAYNIGVQDSPTVAQIMTKLKDLYEEFGPPGVVSIVGSVISFVHAKNVEWTYDVFQSSPAAGTSFSVSGTNPTSSTITAFLAYDVHGTFTSPDGVSTVVF